MRVTPSDKIQAIFVSCRKGPAASQRGPRCITAACPLQADGVLVADQRGPYGKTAGFFLPKNDVRMLKLQEYNGIFIRI